MIKIFCDCCPFLAKKLAFFFKKTNVMIQLLQNAAALCVKDAIFFAMFFGENVFKTITPVPGRFSQSHCRQYLHMFL
jgi:hypothetical protein